MKIITIDNYLEMMKDNEYYDDLIENSPCESCPDCGNDFDDADFDFQICSRCGWDADN